jgi:hypothetical protein
MEPHLLVIASPRVMEPHRHVIVIRRPVMERRLCTEHHASEVHDAGPPHLASDVLIEAQVVAPNAADLDT